MKEFIKHIENVAARHSFSGVFDDLLTIMICMFSLGRDEDRYFETIKRYDKRELNELAMACGELINVYNDKITKEGGWFDPLGDLFMEHNGRFGASARGQFFTPETVCDFMAKITYDHTEKDLLINDPACGSARTLIAFDRCHPQNRFKNFYVAQDLDSRCVKMAVLNMYMHGMKGLVMHMDTLRMECFGGYRVYLPDTMMGVQPLTSAQTMQYYFGMLQEKTEQISEPAEILFDSTPQIVNAVAEMEVQQYQKATQLKLFA